MYPVEITRINLKDGTLYLATSPYIDGYALEETEDKAKQAMINAIALKVLQEANE